MRAACPPLCKQRDRHVRPCVHKVNTVVVKHKLITGSTVFQIQNDQCQEMDQSSDKKWLKLTNHGEWATHTVRAAEQLQALRWTRAQKAGGPCAVWLAALIAICSVLPVAAQRGQ